MALTPLTTAQAERINRRTGTAVELQAGSRIKELEERATALEGVDAAAEPCTAIGYLGNRTVAQINALTPAKGDVVVATDSGTPTAGASDALTAGDVAEYDGTQWQKLLDGVGGFVPDGTVLLVQAPVALFAPLTTTTDNGKVCTFDGLSNTPVETVPTDGDRRTVAGEESVNENDGFVYDASSKTWVRNAPGLSDATPAAIAESGTAGSLEDASRANHTHAHGNQGSYAGSLHDADQVDYERTAGLRARIQSGSGSTEAALTDLDDALAAVLVRGYRGTRSIAQIDAGLAGLATGDVVVLEDAGTPAAPGSDAGVIGSVMEYDGAAWQQILAGSGGFVPAGTRLIVSGGALFAPITEGADENKIALFTGATNTPTLRSPVDGEVRLVKGETATEEGQSLVYDAGSTAWARYAPRAADTTFADTDSTFAATTVEAAIAEARNTLRTRASVAVTLTAGGALAVSRSSILIDTFAAAASDDVESITGMETGQIAILGIVAAARNAVIKHVGTIKCHGGVDITLDAADDMALVFYDGASHHVRALNLAALETVGLHAATHVTGGADAIQPATAAQPGLATAAQITKLDGIEALADVTDLANVSTALGTTAAVAVTTTNVGAGDAGKLLKLDGAGKAAGRVLETDGAKLDTFAVETNYTLKDGTRAFTGVVAGVTPVGTTDLATKGYVDSVAQGLRLKPNADVATTGALADAYTSAATTLTRVGNGAFPTIDGVAPALNAIYLVKNQAGADEKDNGWYKLTTVGTAGTPWVLTRIAEADAAAEIEEGSFGWVKNGTVNANTRWAVLVGPTTLGTDLITFTQIGGALSTEAGAALAQNGAALDVQVDGATIEINADALRVKAAGLTDAHVAAANKDGVAGTASMRTLGAGAQQAMAGNAAPNAHAASHVGADAIQSATAAQAGLATAAQITKLDGIEALADVTDLANVTTALGVTAAVAVATSAGAGDSGKAIKLTGAGKVDTSMLVAATEAIVGAAELATQAETDTGTDDARAVTPLKLATTPRLPTQGENDALVGTTGTPSTTNKYVTNDDLRVPRNRLTIASDGTLDEDAIGAAVETVVGTITLTSAMLNTARRVIKFTALARRVTKNAADTVRLRVRLGGLAGTLVADSTALDVLTTTVMRAYGEIQIRTTGAGGTFDALGTVRHAVGASPMADLDTLAGAVDTTVSRDLVVTLLHSTNADTNISRVEQFDCEVWDA